MNETKIIARNGLAENDFALINHLAQICREYDQCELKINWDWLYNRDSSQFSDFFYFYGDEPIAYLELDGFGYKFEITGLVQPDYRRRGYFRELIAVARQEALRRGAKEILLVNYRNSVSGRAFVKAMGYPYRFSEYRMEASAATMPPLPPSELELVTVQLKDLPEFARLLSLAFPEEDWNTTETLQSRWEEPQTSHYFARLNGKNIGQIATSDEGNGIYIGAVGIIPELRGKGYGRQLLAKTLSKLLAENHSAFRLDVETDNENALTLYQSCGFATTNIYDYYQIL
jgi:predicted GNAT family acetyltransferase